MISSSVSRCGKNSPAVFEAEVEAIIDEQCLYALMLIKRTLSEGHEHQSGRAV